MVDIDKNKMTSLPENLLQCQELQPFLPSITFSCIDEVPTKTLVTFVGSGGSLRIGFAFRTHSSLTVYYDDAATTPTTTERPLRKSFPPVCTMFLVFHDTITEKTESQLTNTDLKMTWMNFNVVEEIHSALKSQRSMWGETFDHVIDAIHDHSVEQLEKIMNYVRKGLPEFDVAIVFKNDEEHCLE